MSRLRIPGFAVGLLAALAAGDAAAAMESWRLAEMRCRAVLDGTTYEGPVEAQIWSSRPLPEPEIRRLARGFAQGLEEGRVDRMPGMVSLLGQVGSRGRRPVVFELYLPVEGPAIGSLWREGRRESEVLVTFEPRPGGIAILSDGAVIPLDCGL